MNSTPNFRQNEKNYVKLCLGLNSHSKTSSMTSLISSNINVRLFSNSMLNMTVKEQIIMGQLFCSRTNFFLIQSIRSGWCCRKILHAQLYCTRANQMVFNNEMLEENKKCTYSSLSSSLSSGIALLLQH